MFSVQQVFLLPSSSSTEFIRTQVIPAPEIGFIAGVAQVAGVGLFLLLLPKALKLAGFLTSVCWRVVSVSPASLVEAFPRDLAFAWTCPGVQRKASPLVGILPEASGGLLLATFVYSIWSDLPVVRSDRQSSNGSTSQL